MKDTTHTNKQRIEKIKCLICGIHNVKESGMYNEHQIDSLLALSDEAEGALEALEEFLAERRALDNHE